MTVDSSSTEINGGGSAAHATSARQPQRLVLCLDGTWDARSSVISQWQNGSSTSKPSSDDYWTNVALLNFAIPPWSQPDKDGKSWRQQCFYQNGIGSDEVTALGRLLVGATGSTLLDKVREAYGWLVDNYFEGDEIFLFGFSRGAYTARCLSGFIAWAGILSKSKCTATRGADAGEGNTVVESVYFTDIFQAYCARRAGDQQSIERAAQVLYDRIGRWPAPSADDTKRANGARSGQSSVTLPSADGEDVVPPTIKVLGVWDTVGALGIPGFFKEWKLYSFFDPGLSPNVANAFQALALSEDRQDFLPTLWYKPWPSQEGQRPRQANQVMRQTWFAGSHANVGGGHPYHGLSDVTLAWMVAQIRDASDGPLLDINIDTIRALQDRRERWANEAIYPSRSPLIWRETRTIQSKPEEANSGEIDWANNVYSGLTNESIHHSVVVCGLFNKKSPQFSAVRQSHPELLDQMWTEAESAASLLPTERLLQWSAAEVRQPPAKPAGPLLRPLLKVLAATSTLTSSAVSSAVNFKIIPARDQTNLKVTLAAWAKGKIRGRPGPGSNKA